MNLLEHIDRIITADPTVDAPRPRWRRGDCHSWSLKMQQVGPLGALVRVVNPTLAIETGTCEGIGTTVIAEAMGGGRLVTFDMEHKWEGGFSDDDCANLSKIRRENLERARAFGTVIDYIDGNTEQVLGPTILSYAMPWDFWFQDSMHLADQILSEWNQIEHLAAPGAVVVFDDIQDGHCWIEKFAEVAPNWVTYHFNAGGACQLWAQNVS